MTRTLEKIWETLISLKLAVLVISGLALTLSVATVMESKYDTKTAQYFVYRASWFYGLLGLLGMNILAVALSRLPWKKKHIPFLMAHAGILMILVGSWITYSRGLDGTLQISEGEMNSTVELDQHVLVFKQDEAVKTVPFEWRPQSVARDFKPQAFPEEGVRVERYISDAEPRIQFFQAGAIDEKAAPAIQIRILGAPMGGAPELWLWAGDPGWATQSMGPARFVIRREDRTDLEPKAGESGGARLDFIVSRTGALRYQATSVRGEVQRGSISAKSLGNSEDPVVIDPHWRMPIRIQIRKFLPLARNLTDYIPRKTLMEGMGTAMPTPAIQISLLDSPESKMWLGLGDRADFRNSAGLPLSVGYYPRRVILPYAMRLKRFEMKTNPGTMDPAAYSSYVQVVDQFKKTDADLDQIETRHITMNEPLDWIGYTFYQSSYIPESPRPVTTILSVNYDPGRGLKYWGSILLILGSISLYLSKVIQRKPQKEALHA